MRRFLGHLAFCAGLGVLITATGTPVARAAPVYEITVTIQDLTHPSTTTFVIMKGDPNDTSSSPNAIQGLGSFLVASSQGSGLTFTALSADTTIGTSATTLNAHATFQLSNTTTGAVSTDSYVVTILTTHDTYTSPPAAASATLLNTTSGSYANMTSGNTQTAQSWYSPTNTANSTVPPATPPIVQTIPSPFGSLGAVNSSTGVAPFLIPYALTNRLIIDVTGNAGNPSVLQPNIGTTLATVPEPASMVVFLTGIPLPIVLVGLLRRRRAVG